MRVFINNSSHLQILKD